MDINRQLWSSFVVTKTSSASTTATFYNNKGYYTLCKVSLLIYCLNFVKWTSIYNIFI